MSEWITKPLKQLAALRVSNVDKKSSPLERPVRLCNYMDVYSGTYLDDGAEYMEATASQREVETFSLQQGDVIITKDSETPDDIGIPAMIDKPVNNLICGYHLAVLRPFQNEVRPAYLMKQLQSDDVRRYYARRATGSTRYALSTRTIEETPILWVHPDVQEKIAAILRALDTQIEQTEALIAKQEQVRAGLMQDLFTRGIDKSGRLRPPREEAPELYHETEFGWLPKGWSARRLENLLAAAPTPMRSGPFGSALLKHELVENGVPLLGIDNVLPEQFVANFRRFVSPSKFAELERYRVLPNDVIITIMGTVGRCCVVPSNLGEMLSSKHLWTMTFDRQQVLPHLVCWQLNFAPWVAAWFRREGQGGIMEAIQSSTLRRLLMPTPEIAEQHRIEEIYFDASQPLDGLRQQTTKLRLKRSGLMQDLLTGRVPVDALLKERAAA